MDERPGSKLGKGAQTAALVLAIGAVIWGVFATYSVAFPGPSGEWAVIGVFAAWVVDFPVGVLTLVVALTVKHGRPRLRRLYIGLSIVALALPLLASLIWNHWRL